MASDLSNLLVDAVKKYSKILIFIPGSPDPDALASAHALKIILSKFKIEATIGSVKKLSLSQNKAFVKILRIPLVVLKSPDHSKYDSYIVVDYQSNYIENISGNIPCAAHIDHHAADCRTVPADFTLIRPEVGSTSALVAHLLEGLDDEFSAAEMSSMSTALLFGIQSDTDGFIHASAVDMDAMKYLSAYSDSKKVNKISGIPLPAETMDCYKKAMENEQVYRGWGLYGIGYIDVDHRDSLAISADLLLKKTGYDLVAVYALVEDREKEDVFIDVSFRTVLEFLDLNSLIKKITPTGGGRRYKGAYQVRIRYFSDCPERELLWKVVESTTLEKIKHARDGIYLDEIKNLSRRAFDRVSAFLKNK